MAIGLFNRVLSFTTSAIGSSKTARSLKKKTYWVQAQKLFKYDVELLEAWEKAILENAQDWELYYFYGHIRNRSDLIHSLKNTNHTKRTYKAALKREKERYVDPNKYMGDAKFTDPKELEEEREQRRKMIFIYEDIVDSVELDRQVSYRDLAKLGTLQGIHGFEDFLSGHNPIHPYKYHTKLEELGDICLNPDDLPKDKRKELEEEYERVYSFKFRSKASKKYWKGGNS